jgi:hypothetical protein
MNTRARQSTGKRTAILAVAVLCALPGVAHADHEDVIPIFFGFIVGVPLAC